MQLDDLLGDAGAVSDRLRAGDDRTIGEVLAALRRLEQEEIDARRLELGTLFGWLPDEARSDLIAVSSTWATLRLPD